jgi:PAS domain-containing protein
MAALEPEFGPASVSSEVLRLAFARSPSGITVSARDGRRLWVNDAYCRMPGYDQPERSEELAREQALTELEQAIGDREQPIAADAGTIRRAMARAEAAEVRAQAGHPSEAG